MKEYSFTAFFAGRAALLRDADPAPGERRPPQRHRPQLQVRASRDRQDHFEISPRSVANNEIFDQADPDAVGRRPGVGPLRRPRPPLLALHQVHRPLGE